MSRSLTDTFKAMAERHRDAVKASTPLAKRPPPADAFVELGRALLATDSDLVRRVGKRRDRAKILQGPINTFAEYERALMQIWRSVAGAASYDPDSLLRDNNRVAILGGLQVIMASLILKAPSPECDPAILREVAEALRTIQRDALKVRRQIQGAIRHRGQPVDLAAAWLRKNAPLWRLRRPEASTSAGAIRLFELAKQAGLTKWGNSESLRVWASKNGVRI